MGIGNTLIGGVERLLVDDTLRRKDLFRYSDRHGYAHQFERQVSEMLGAENTLLLPSATLALQTYLQGLNLAAEDEIIIPPLSWVADYSAILLSNATPRMCSLDDELQVTLDSIKELVNTQTRAILIPHLMGRGQQAIAQIAQLCEERDITLIEDIAQSFGVKIAGAYAGSYGDFAFCSLNHHKILSAGDGGFGVYHHKNDYRAACQYHDQGCLIAQDGTRTVDEDQYAKGLSMRSTNVTGAIALAQLARLPQITHLIRSKHQELLDAIGPAAHKHLIQAHQGDIPYCALLRRPPTPDYPSLLDSGWHFIKNIPYYESLSLPEQDHEHIRQTGTALEQTYAVGTGFIDTYYAIARGARINQEFSDELITSIKEQLA